MRNRISNFERLTKLEGIGCARKRREDPRFIQGKGNYVDDVKMPGMAFGAMVRSPYAHARIKRIDTSRALALPGVVAVITAEELKPFKLHWMPTLAGDVQAVLADGKVSFQNQEVAFVIAEDRYIAADAAELVEVEYEELPAVVDPFKALEPGAPVIREDLAGKSTGAHGARRHHNHIFNWQIGDKDKTARAFENADVTVKQDMLYPRVHPCPLETCGCVASFDKVKGDLTVYITSQAPHVVRTVVGLLSSIPESKIRIISPDIGGGFGNKVGVYPGYVCAIASSIVLGRPVKWIESRAENLTTTAFARDYWMTGELAATKDGSHQGAARYTSRRITARSMPAPTRLSGRRECSMSAPVPTPFPTRSSRSMASIPTNFLAVSLIAAPSASPRRSISSSAWSMCWRRSSASTRRRSGCATSCARSSSRITTPLGLEYDSGDYEPALRKAMAAMDYRALRAEQAARRKDPDAEWLMGIGIVTFTEIVGAGPSKMCDILGVGMFDSCEIRVHPDGSAIARMGTITPGPGPPDHLCADHRDRGGHSRLGDSGRGGRHLHRALRTRHLRLALHAGCGRRHCARVAQDPREGAARSPRICWKSVPTISSSISTASWSRARPSR